ncbi:MAG: exodeoxyribonuclease VII large subunit [Candidatus Omnitrophica bacterium]|nr:exodeoxyribonuclease VII large subunit [Candidatus Omnitrophota bacterium]
MKSDARRIYTVSGITRDIKALLENTFGEVWVEGEVSNFKAAASGHYYFSLKDVSAMLNAAMFSRANRSVSFKLEDGLKVVCFGKIDVYAPRGQYQLIVERIEPQGIGARQLAFEQLKKRLYAEGLFDEARKQALPAMPFCAGVVTSSHGAAIRDILQVLRKGAGCVDVVIRPVLVQGGKASAEIAQAVDDFNRWGRVDLIIVSRGGGSTEDLWAFNEEAVARAVSRSRLPVISAVGHQINTTLCDLTADVFVETPTAAAKIIADKRHAALQECMTRRHELSYAIAEQLGALRHGLASLKGMLKSPLDRLLEKQQYLDELTGSLRSAWRQYMRLSVERLRSLGQRLEALSPHAVLSRGYSVTMLLPGDRVVSDIGALQKGSRIKTILGEGACISTVEETQREGEGA